MSANTTVAIVDCETTGLEEHDQPISIGLLLVEIDQQGRLLNRLDQYYGTQAPTVPIHPTAQKMHGMTAESLRGHRFDMGKIAEILSRAEIAVAHNASFDARMISKIAPFNRYWRCSVNQFPWVLETSRKLDDVCSQLGVDRPLPHNALADCEALLSCLLKHKGKTERSRTYLSLLLARDGYPVVTTTSVSEPNRSNISKARRTNGTGGANPIAVTIGKVIGALLKGLFSGGKRR